jgi:hypothetical protein
MGSAFARLGLIDEEGEIPDRMRPEYKLSDFKKVERAPSGEAVLILLRHLSFR